jgi:hypothetical protein
MYSAFVKTFEKKYEHRLRESLSLGAAIPLTLTVKWKCVFSENCPIYTHFLSRMV